MFDVVIRGGQVIDGSGSDAFEADVALQGARIAEVGRVSGRGAREIDARGRLVVPGFVDPHTHFDAQMTWDPLLDPSSHHGVTTVVTGNCGVGFAPARPDRHEWLIGVMAGVEDIPAPALAEGLPWGWEHFHEFMDVIDAQPRAMDVATLATHGPIRAYVMGERCEGRSEPTAEEIHAMAQLAGDALACGALGFSTSRTSLHLSLEGIPVPSTYASWQELRAFAEVLQAAGGAIFQLALPNSFEEPLRIEEDLATMLDLSAELSLPFTFNFALNHADTAQWGRMCEMLEAGAARGARVHPMVLGRPHSVLVGLQGLHPFLRAPSYRALAALPLGERVAEMSRPEVRARILGEELLPPDPADPYADVYDFALEHLYRLGDRPDYEPSAGQSVAALARERGGTPREVLYDLLLEEEGRSFLLYVVMNFPDQSLEAVREMICHPQSVLGLSDAGAHCGSVCDGSAPTSLLTHWCRDRKAGDGLPLPWMVRALSSEPATLFGLRDRGLLRPGMKADVNVIDFETLGCELPEMRYDLPTGARRLGQRARGYAYTFLSGELIREGGEDTGARPGRLVRRKVD